MTSAVVIGAGPNGLAAAVTLARAGVTVTVLEAANEIGGGTRTSDLTGHGCLHDHCSAAHPFALGSVLAREAGLADAGLRLCQPDVDFAHPLADGTSAAVVRSLDETATRLGRDGPAWRRVFGPFSTDMRPLLDDIFRPVLHLPQHPVLLARFGLRAALPADAVARTFRTVEGRALWAGLAAHVFAPFSQPLSSAVGLTLGSAAHSYGWVVAEGGSRAITDAMAKVLLDHGGSIETGTHIQSLAELPSRDLTLLDIDPSTVIDLAGSDLPFRAAQAYRRWRHGPGAFKLDLVVEGGVPWRDEASRHAGTVHVGGTHKEIARAELAAWQGRMPERPFVIVCQQYLADPSRSAGDLHPIYTYAHVPNGYTGDATEVILDQLERFAPGLRDRIIARHTTIPSAFERANPNLIGGDVIGGANTPCQTVFRPRLSLNPYATGIPHTYLCSSATPPGAGAHGMCGFLAAKAALRAAP